MDLLTYLKLQWDRAGAWLCVAAGAVLLLIGWLGVSREVLPAAQLPYIISGGLGGLFLLGFGAVLWLSADLRDEWRQLREIAGALERQTVAEVPEAVGVDGSANGSSTKRRRPQASRPNAEAGSGLDGP